VLGLAVAGWSGWNWWLGREAGTIHSIAVLPFANVNADQDIDYLADGVTDGIISELSQLSDLKVLSRTAVLLPRCRDRGQAGGTDGGAGGGDLDDPAQLKKSAAAALNSGSTPDRTGSWSR
jgi:hypothetical protein